MRKLVKEAGAKLSALTMIIMGSLLNCVASESKEECPRNNKMLFDFIIFGEKGFLFRVLHGWLLLFSSLSVVGAGGLPGLGVEMGTLVFLPLLSHVLSEQIP